MKRSISCLGLVSHPACNLLQIPQRRGSNTHLPGRLMVLHGDDYGLVCLSPWLDLELPLVLCCRLGGSARWPWPGESHLVPDGRAVMRAAASRQPFHYPLEPQGLVWYCPGRTSRGIHVRPEHRDNGARCVSTLPVNWMLAGWPMQRAAVK